MADLLPEGVWRGFFVSTWGSFVINHTFLAVLRKFLDVFLIFFHFFLADCILFAYIYSAVFSGFQQGGMRRGFAGTL
jgi:hypothetical protein